MNKIFKVIWCHATQSWVAVSELQKAKGKTRSVKTAASLLAGGLLISTAYAAINQSTNGKFTAGAGTGSSYATVSNIVTSLNNTGFFLATDSNGGDAENNASDRKISNGDTFTLTAGENIGIVQGDNGYEIRAIAPKATVVTNGRGTTVNFNNDTANPNYEVIARVDGSTMTFDSRGNIAAKTTTYRTTTTGAVGTPADSNALATAQTIANAINSSGFNVTAGDGDGTNISGKSSELINPGETVTFDAGKNMKLVQEGGKFTYATKDEVDFTNVTVGADGSKITINNDGINMNGKSITNISNGLAKSSNGLLNLVNSLVQDGTAATVGDLRNMGWVVSSNKTTGAVGVATDRAFTQTVKNAGQVEFVGTGAAKVSGAVVGNKNVITVHVDNAATNTAAESPNIYFHTNNGTNSGGNAATNLGKPNESAGAAARNSMTAGVNATVEGATSVNSIAMGYGANITEATTMKDGTLVGSSNSIAMGTNATVKGQKSVAIGYNTNITASADNETSGVAIGDTATVNAKNSIAIGYKANVTTTGQGSSIALGDQSSATNSYAYAIGTKAAASGTGAMALSYNAQAKGQNSVALGESATAGISNDTSYGEIAIGTKSNATAKYSSAVGVGATASGEGSVANGHSANATGNSAVAIARLAAAAGQSSLAIGERSNASKSNAVALGKTARALGENSMAIGLSSHATDTNATAIGNTAKAWAVDSLSFGTNAKVNTPATNGISIGKDSLVSGANGTSIGTSTNALANAVAIGNSANASKTETIAIGNEAKAETRYGLAIGNNAVAGSAANAGYRAAAIGDNAEALGNDTIAFGTNATADAVSAIAIGRDTNNTGSASVAIGDNVTVSAARSVALGRNINVTKEENVVLGSWSTETSATITEAGKVDEITNATVGGVTYDGFAGTRSVGVVSFGRDKSDGEGGDGKDGERRLINVGAGEISERSTDAINGSQLYSVIKNTFFNLETYENGGVADDSEVTDEENKRIRSGDTFALGAGSGINISQVDKGYEIAIEKGDIQVNTDTGAVTTADAETDGKVATAYDVVNAISKSGFKVKSGSTGTGNNSTEGDLKTNGELINPADTLTYIAGDNLDVSHTKDGNFTFKTKENVTFNTVTANTSLTIGTGTGLTKLTSTANGLNVANSTGGATKITNVANGEISAASTDAINGSQLSSFMDTVNKSKWTLSTSQNNATATKVGDINLEDGVVIDGQGAVKVTSTAEKDAVSKVHIAVETDNSTIKQENGQLVAATTNLTPNTNGTIKAADTTGLVTGNQVANAINSSGFTLSVEDNTNATLVKPGSQVDLNNSDDNIVITKKGTDNNVTFNLNNTLKLGDATVNPTGTKLTIDGNKGEISGLNTTLQAVQNGQNLANPFSNTNPAPQTRAATLGDVLNVGWNLQENSAAKDFINAYDTVNFVNGTGTTANVSVAGNVASVTFNVTNTTLTVNDTVTSTDAGKITTPTDENKNKFVTAGDLAEAINKTGFKVKADKTGTGSNSTPAGSLTNGELINPADTLTYIAGDNLDVLHAANGNFTFKTKQDVAFNTVTANTSLTVGKDANTTKLTSTSEGLNVANSTGGATKITNVANGTNSNDAVNFSQLEAVKGQAWNLKVANGTAAETNVGDSNINANDAVIIRGTGAINVAADAASTANKYALNISVATDGTTIKVSNDGKLTAVTKPLTTDNTTGKAKADDATSLVTGNQVATAINNAGLSFSGDTGEGTTNKFARKNQEETKIVGGQTDKTKLSDEKNIGVVSNGADTLTVKLAKDIKVDSVNATNNVTIGGTVVSKADNGLNFATGAAKTILDGITSGLKTLNSGNPAGLLDLTTLPTGTTVNTAATVGDLQKMGWVVSSDKTTSGTGAYNAQVKNANEVRFIGTGIATVSGKNEGDIRTITVDVQEKSAQNVVQEAQLPVVYTKADGTKVVKATDGNFYLADQVNTDGSLKDPAKATVVPTTDVIASLNSGANSTTTPTALSNVKSNLDEARNAASTVTDAGKTHTAEAAVPTTVNKNNAATVGDVLNAGWNLKENNAARDFVKAYDTVNFVNGTGTTANVSMNADGTVANVTFNVNTTTLSVADGATAGQPKGSISTPTNANNFVTANNLATAINGAGFTVFENNGASEKSLVNAGDKVSFNNGTYTTASVGTEANNTTNVTFNVDGAKLVADNSPVVYTDKDGNKVLKGTDGNYYQAKADGTPDTAKKVEPDNIVASMQNITNGNKPTAGNVFTLTNVKSNLPTVNDTTTVITNPDGTTVKADPANIKAAPLTAAQAVNLMQNSANNAATLGDVLNAGWNLQGNGNAVDFVKPFDTVNFKDGANTKVVTDSNGTTSNVTVNVVGLPVAYTTAAGEPVVKVGDKFYKVDAQGNPTGNALTDEDAGKLVANVINPKAAPNSTGNAITLGNIASAVKTLDGSNRGDKATGDNPTTIDASSPLGNALKTAYSGLADLVNAPQNHAVTVADLRNLGWVVSATGNDYADDVRHANEVRFVGTGLAKVTGKTDDSGVRTITVDVNAQNTVEAAQTPVVYTNANGDKLTKIDDKFYKVNDVENGKPKTGATEVKPVDVIASMNAGNNTTNTPTTLANVKSNLADVGTLAAQPNANKPADLASKLNNAATVGDVLNAGWNLQGNGKAVDTVVHNDTVDFVNGRGTTVTVEKDKDGKNTIKVDSAIEFVNTTATDTSTPSTTAKLTGTAPVQLGNVASGVRKADGSTLTGKDLADAVAKASGNTLTNAVNVGDLQAVAKAATTKVDGDQGVSVKPTTNEDGSTTYTVAAKTDGTTIKVDDSGNLAAVTGELKNKADGKVDTPAAPNALVTAQTVADAINNAGFNLQANGDTASLVKTGDTVQFLNGKNIEISRNGNNITVATAKEVEFDKVTVGPVTIDKTDGINAGNKQIKGVAEGTDGTDAVNVNQLKTETAKAKTEVTGTGFAVVTSKAGDKGQTIYNVDVAKADTPTVTRGSVTVKADDENKVMSAGDVAKAITDSEKTSSVKAGSKAVTVTNTAEDAKGNTEYTVDVATDKTIARDNDGKLTVNTGSSLKVDGTTGKIDVNTDGTTITTDATTGAVKANTTALTNAANGKVNAPAAPNALATAGDIANAINNSGFTLKTSANGGSKVSGADEVINPGETIDMAAGKNLTVKQDASGKVTYATADNVNFTTVNSTTVVVGNPADPSKSTTLTSGNGGLNVGGDKITGVAAGDISPASTDAVNGSQLYNLQQVVGGNTLNSMTTTPVQLNNGTTVNIVTSNGYTLKTYNVKDQTNYVTNNIVEAIGRMNEEGIKFFHVNDENVNKSKVQSSNDVDSSASGAYSAAIGYQAVADGDASVALGKKAIAAEENAIAIGINAQANAKNTISIGNGNIVNGENSGAIGDPSKIDADNSYSVGNNNEIAAGQSDVFALGNDVKATASNSVFLGSKSGTFEQENASVGTNGVHKKTASSHYTYNGENDSNVAGVNNAVGVVSVGNSQETRQVQGVAAGVVSATSTDAINGSQLYYTNKAINDKLKNVGDTINKLGDTINKNNKDLRGGIAGTNAAASLPQVYLPGKSMVAASAGTYKGQGAIAVGYSRASDNGKLILKLQGNANTRGDVGAGIGIGYQW